jgi:hypothetical protein
VGAGIGSDKGEASSTSSAGISGIAGNTAVRSTDAETGIQKIFDAAKVQREIDAQVQITQAFGKEASKAVGTYAIEKVREASALRRQANAESDETVKAALNARAQALEEAWGPNGASRIALHAVIGGLGGGINGAAGAAAATYTTSQLAEQIFSSDIPPALKETLVVALGGLAGAVVGGGSGAAAGLNEAGNNAVHLLPIAIAEGALIACVRIPACVQGVARALVAGGAYVSSAAAAAAIAAHSDAVTQFVADKWNDVKRNHDRK